MTVSFKWIHYREDNLTSIWVTNLATGSMHSRHHVCYPNYTPNWKVYKFWEIWATWHLKYCCDMQVFVTHGYQNYVCVTAWLWTTTFKAILERSLTGSLLKIATMENVLYIYMIRLPWMLDVCYCKLLCDTTSFQLHCTANRIRREVTQWPCCQTVNLRNERII